MPLASIHLLAFHDKDVLPDLVRHIKSSSVRPLVISKPIRWIIVPEKIETAELLNPTWDLLLIVYENQESQAFISMIRKNPTWKVTDYWSTVTGIPSRLVKSFEHTNQRLLHPDSMSVPELTGAWNKPLLQSSSQSLAMSADLQTWVTSISDTIAGRSAVSMLNLLAFKPEMKPSYLKYGKAFAETIGARRGGNAKLVGNIVHPSGESGSEKGGNGWDEFALAHYPSILHFADMLASTDYQAVNQKYRVPSLKDTCILCTSETEIEAMYRSDIEKPKL